jgi:hypothetical protein
MTGNIACGLFTLKTVRLVWLHWNPPTTMQILFGSHVIQSGKILSFRHYYIGYDMTLRDRRPLLVNYPAYRAAQAFQESGFELQNTLIWMEKRFKT